MTLQQPRDFSLESQADDHLRVIMRRMKDIAFRLTVVTVTLVTICEVKVELHRLADSGRILHIQNSTCVYRW